MKAGVTTISFDHLKYLILITKPAELRCAPSTDQTLVIPIKMLIPLSRSTLAVMFKLCRLDL